MGRAIRKLLIANRGEIACRIARAAREAGIQSLSLFTDKEVDFPQRTLADESADLGDGSLKDTYLNPDRLIAIARQYGCDAVHPGYGFLSENAQFAAACEKAGLVFIGPSAQAIAAMGDKRAAKMMAEKAGVPVVPGYSGDDQTDARLCAEGKRIGFPLLIKASAGGGGKGMRVVQAEGELLEALAAARREAKAAFGDDQMILEKYIARARHIEVQVAADAHGNAVHFGERECTAQRRHQKVVEEAPSPVVDAKMRAQLGAYALALLNTIHYTNVGTVEFVVDETSNPYFLEMNTRLQVEHPVTEWVYGIDLVQLQFRLAEGKALGLSQSDIVPRGHAIECRLYAEDPEAGFLPAIGKILHLALPQGPGIRLDLGVREGNIIHIAFDPLWGKLIAYGEDRAQAIARMTAALRDTVCFGVQTNIAYLANFIASEVFRRAAFHTRYLESMEWKQDAPSETVLHLAQAALSQKRTGKQAEEIEGSPWERLQDFRV